MNTTGRIVPLDTNTHQAVQALLPWFVRERLHGAEREQVEAHLASCPHCQAELESERRLQAAHRQLGDGFPAGSTLDVERGLAAVHAQIAALPRERRRAALQGLAAWWRQGPVSWRWLLSAQCLVIVLLGIGLLWPADAPEPYRALGGGNSTAAASGNAVVMFRAGASELALRQALLQSGVRLVDGPTASGAYVVFAPDAAALQRLRAQPAVALAQSLEAEVSR